MSRRRLSAAGVVWALSVGACAHDTAAPAPHEIREIVEAAQAPYDSPGLTSTAFVSGRRLVPVRSDFLTSGVAAFQVLARETQLEKAPCSGCHTLPLAELVRKHPANQPRAHWAVSVKHASASVMTCATCHAADSVGQLRMLGGEKTFIDHAYQLCAQCHSTQAADWIGGAHGKRAGGWVPPRISFNCTECHDPHGPAFAPRWPAHAGRTP